MQKHKPAGKRYSAVDVPEGSAVYDQIRILRGAQDILVVLSRDQWQANPESPFYLGLELLARSIGQAVSALEDSLEDIIAREFESRPEKVRQ